MNQILFSLCCAAYIGAVGIAAAKPAVGDQDLARFSYYMGYKLWRDHTKRTEIDYDLDQVITGMQAAAQGAPLDLDGNEDLDTLIRRMQRIILAKQQEKHLSAANTYMLERIAEEDTILLVPGKLCYKTLKSGTGEQVTPDSTQLLVVDCQTLERGQLMECFGEEEPTPVYLPSTIAGFYKGVSGMRKGEKRRLYVHPDLGYGEQGGLVGPNRLLVFDVEVKELQNNS